MDLRRPSLAKGLITGVVAGIAATLVMDQFQALLSKAEQANEKRKKLAQGESQGQIAEEQAESQKQKKSEENSTEIVARKVAEAAGTTLPTEKRKTAGQAVHYTFGTLMGLVYATTAEWLPELTAGAGAAYGTLLFLTADEVAVPAFELAPPPTETPVSGHLQHWAAHMVYGTTLEAVRNLVRRWL